MGRSGGGSSSHHSSGGHSSSSHSSFGGHSHSSSSGRSGRSGYSSGSHTYHTSGLRNGYSHSYSNYDGQHYYDDAYHYGGYRYSGSNFLTKLVVWIVLLLFIASVSSSIVANSDNMGSQVQKSTIERTKLDESRIDDVGYINDTLGWFTSEYDVNQAAKYFQDKTGVAPYILIQDSIDGKYTDDTSIIQPYMDQYYKTNFTDEQHFLILFMDDGNGNWGAYYYGGAATKGVMDKEAGEIVLDYFDAYNGSNMNDDEYFSLVLRKSADRIMIKTKSAEDYMTMIIIAAFCVIGAIIVVKVILKIVERKKELAEERRKILNTPIDGGVDEDGDVIEPLDPLKARYGDKDADKGHRML